MDIAKIRKKLKKGGGSKTRKAAGKKSQPEPSAQPDASSSEPEKTGKKISPPGDTELIREDILPVEESPVFPAFDNETEETVPVVELLSFSVSGQAYAFRVEDIQEILRSQLVTPVPGADPYLVGITSLRGTIIPVMDLSQRLVLHRKHNYGKRAKILVAQGPKGIIGVLLESAVKVLSIPVTSVDESPDSLSEGEMRFISAVTRDSGRLVFIMNVEELFNFSDKVEAR